MTVDDRMQVFEDMIGSVSSLDLLVLNGQYEKIHSNRNSAYELNHKYYFLGGRTPSGFQLPASDDIPDKPVFFKNPVGMSWISDPVVKDGQLHRIYLLGPVFPDEYSLEHLSRQLDEREVTVRLKHEVLKEAGKVPVMPLTTFLSFGIMLHKVLTGETIWDTDFITVDQSIPKMEAESSPDRELRGMYEMEQVILTLIREGNLNIGQEMKRFTRTEKGLYPLEKDGMRLQKDMMILLLTICTRGAVEGGVASETAYLLRSNYLTEIEKTDSVFQLASLAEKMLTDYAYRVHIVRQQSDVSPRIRAACDYMELHPEQKPDIHMLAQKAGYQDYYFSRKFKQEMNISVRDYSMKCKIEKACQYLKDTSMSVDEICDALGFVSRSHFGEVFRKQMGMSPIRYRETH